MCAMLLWRSQDEYSISVGITKHGVVTSCTRRSIINGLKQVSLKPKEGRGLKPAVSVYELHIDLQDDFDDLRRAGVKCSYRTLRMLAR